jgi:integrase
LDISNYGGIMTGKIIKLEIGTVYQKTANGSYYFRYQVNGQRKAVSLKTKNQKEAHAKAQDLLPIIKATNAEVISAHVKHAKGLVIKQKNLALRNAWEVYSKHPDRATPATVAEQIGYRTTLREFIRFAKDDSLLINDISPETADEFAKHLRKSGIAVDTHNRKMKRIKKIFEVLKDYRGSVNPFTAKSLRRKSREEQAHITRRMSFSRAQEAKLLEALDDDNCKVPNKPEIKVIYYLGMFTGQRLKDCVLLQWHKVDLNKKRIWVKQFKTGKEVTIPMAPKLFEALTEAQKWKQDNYVCPNIAEKYNQVDKAGKNTGASRVGVDVMRVVKWIGLETSAAVPGRTRKATVYGFHSLRHSFASHCAEAGVPKAVVLSILGTNSKIVDEYYTHIGEDAQEKAINSLFGEDNSISDRERIEKALSIINAAEVRSNTLLEVEKALRA